MKRVLLIVCLGLSACATPHRQADRVYAQCVKERTEVFDLELVSAYNNRYNSHAFDDLIETRAVCAKQAKKALAK